MRGSGLGILGIVAYDSRLDSLDFLQGFLDFAQFMKAQAEL